MMKCAAGGQHFAERGYEPYCQGHHPDLDSLGLDGIRNGVCRVLREAALSAAAVGAGHERDLYERLADELEAGS